MGVFKILKSNYLINRIFSVTIVYPNILLKKIYDILTKRWQPFGIVDCNFLDIKFKYFSKADDGLVNYFYYGLNYPEASDLKLFLLLAEKSKSIVDIGANTGLYSILASKKNSNCKIYAIEPYSTNYQRLNYNIKINACENIKSYKIAIGDINGEISMTVPDNNSITDVSSVNSDFSEKIYPELKWKQENVIIKTLDEFSKENVSKIDLIKCDVESFEVEVFDGLKEVALTQKPIILFESFLDDKKMEYFNSFIKEYNYYVYLIFSDGIVFMKEGFIKDKPGFNYLITSKKPVKTYISFESFDFVENLMVSK